MRIKKIAVLFLQYLYQISFYSDNFWHTCTKIISYNLHISYSLQSRKQGTSLNFKSTANQLTTVELLHHKTLAFITSPNLWLPNIQNFSSVN